jgi:ABC-type multidrug transport system fused ATPase/permease subunit
MSLQSSSSFRPSGQRDERRRRLLSDELANQGDWPASQVESSDDPPASKSDHYGDAQFLERQLRLRDLIPRRKLSLVFLLGSGIAVLASLIAAYVWMLGRTANGGTIAAALDLGVKGSLGCWFSSLLLLASTFTAILIYSIRRHRTDDYQGRYRIWLWAALCSFLMATDQAASLREGFRDLMIGLTGTPLMGNGDLWWVILYMLALGTIGSRLVVDLRTCPTAMGIFISAAATSCSAVAVRLGWMLPPIGDRVVLFFLSAEMTGNLMLTAALILFARHVILDAEGLLSHHEQDQDDDDDEEVAEVPVRSPSFRDRWRKVDSPHPTPQPVYSRPGVSQPVAVSTPAPINRKLTKAERKALKERLLRERREREKSG